MMRCWRSFGSAAISSAVAPAPPLRRAGGSGFLLTAAHCAVAVDDQGDAILPVRSGDPSDYFVLPGPDYAATHANVFRVAEVKVHPQYDGTVENPYDVAVIRYVGTTSTTPVIPILAPEDDLLVVGSEVSLVGFGTTESSTRNSQRRMVTKPVADLSPRQLRYDQSDHKGSCEGDSGGPALFSTPKGVRVAGVTSYGDASCVLLGVSVRVSAMSAFVQGVIDAAPKSLGCQECLSASTAPGNSCATPYGDCQNTSRACGQYSACVAGCRTVACRTACKTDNAAGFAARSDLTKCECNGACAAVCQGNETCSPAACGDLTVPGAECRGCIQQGCCSEASRCGDDASCSGCFGSSSTACFANPLYHSLLTCLASCSGNPCQVSATSLVVASTPPSVDAGVTNDAGRLESGDAGSGRCAIRPRRCLRRERSRRGGGDGRLQLSRGRRAPGKPGKYVRARRDPALGAGTSGTAWPGSQRSLPGKRLTGTSAFFVQPTRCLLRTAAPEKP